MFSPKSIWPASAAARTYSAGKVFETAIEADGGGIAPGPAGCPRDARANVCQPGPERGSVDHYFFSVPRIPFAVAAFGPAGASFR